MTLGKRELGLIEELKLLYTDMMRDAGPAAQREAQDEVDHLITTLIAHGAEVQAQSQPKPPAVSPAQMMLEIIAELDTAVEIVPPRVARYRKLLVEWDLHRTIEPEGDESGKESGQMGMAGVNLADQAALEFHSHLLGLAFSIAHAEVTARQQEKEENHG